MVTGRGLLIPLRIPELGPALGRLVTGTGRRPGGLSLDDIRIRLVTRLFDAAGEARRLAANNERAAALAALATSTWLDAWEDAVGAVADLVAEQINGRLHRTAADVRLPARLRRSVFLADAERGVIAGRLGAAGADLVTTLHELEREAARLEGATPRERDALDGWQAALRRAGQRLEAAWLALEERADGEMARWDAVVAGVAGWRRSLWPVLLVGVPALVAAVWLGLVLGGYLPAPEWLRALWTRALP